MIRFSLHCDHDHEFDGWFRNNEDFETQGKRGLIACPVCGSTEVEKALMAPAIGGAARENQPVALAMSPEQRKAMAELKALSKKVRENADYVGPKFAEEARKIHFGETEARGIYGEATTDEAKSLAEDGVSFLPLPTFPDDQN